MKKNEKEAYNWEHRNNFFNQYSLIRAVENEPMLYVRKSLLHIIDKEILDMLKSEDSTIREMAKIIILKKYNYNVDKLDYGIK